MNVTITSLELKELKEKEYHFDTIKARVREDCEGVSDIDFDILGEYLADYFNWI